MFCQNCGTQTGESKFCPNCGTQVGGQQNNTSYATQPVDYSQVKSVGLFRAYALMFKNYANFSGRSRRSEYWMAAVANYLLVIIASIVFGAMIISEIEGIIDVLEFKDAFNIPIKFSDFGSLGIYIVIMLVYALIIFIPSLSLQVRRLHDTGKSGWFLLLAFVPMVGSIILFVFMVLDSTPGANKYGPNPKGIN